ncbi:Carbohydrate binding domain-containing protein [Alteromonadaceae bacterium Bs31]|nr:Carbohydrate binding domain-containing protein [Alteromonadaceae bacterium Bs31]
MLNGNLSAGSGDDFDNWGKWNGATGMTETTDSCGGRALQAVSAGGEAYEVQFVSDPATTIVGDEYTASMWIKSDLDAGIVRFSTNSTAGAIYGANESIDTDWKLVTWTFTANDTLTRLVLDLGTSARTYSLDSIALVAGTEAITSICSSASAVDLLLNGNLSAGSGDEFDNWGKWNGGTGMTETTDSCGGRSLQAVSGGGAAHEVQFVSDPVTTVVDELYTASMWIKGDQADGIVRFSTNSTAGAIYGGNETIGTDWQQIMWTFTANDTSTRLVLDLGTSDRTYNVDSISLAAGGASVSSSCPENSPELVVNGGFELGDATTFLNWNQVNGSDKISVSASETYNGSRAVEAAAIGGNEWDVQLESDAITVETGSNYTLSMWIKGATAGGSVRFSTSYSGSGQQYSSSSTIGTDWEQVTWVFAANGPSVNLYLDLGASAVTYYIDDVSLKK